MERGIDDVIILEAEGRIGGRIHSVPYRDGFIDLGKVHFVLSIPSIVSKYKLFH